jgi:hypothetical protein
MDAKPEEFHQYLSEDEAAMLRAQQEPQQQGQQRQHQQQPAYPRQHQQQPAYPRQLASPASQSSASQASGDPQGGV